MPMLRDRKHRVSRAILIEVAGYKSIPRLAAATRRIAAWATIFRGITLEFITFELAALHGAFCGCAAIRSAVARLAVKAVVALTLIFRARCSVSLLSRRRRRSYSLCRRHALVPILCWWFDARALGRINRPHRRARGSRVLFGRFGKFKCGQSRFPQPLFYQTGCCRLALRPRA